MGKTENNKLYMADYYRTRESLSLKYVNMPLNDMKSEIKKNVDECVSRIEKIRSEKMISKKVNI